MKISYPYRIAALLTAFFLLSWFAVRYIQGVMTTPPPEASPIVTISSASPTSAVTTPTPSPLPSVTPSPKTSASPKASPTPKATNSAAISSTTSRVSLAVPFTIQAPDGDWQEPWGEGCEEAALIMVHEYLKGNHEEQLPIAATKAAIKTMVDWQIADSRFGRHRDISMAEMGIVAEEYLKIKATVHKDKSLEDIRNALREGKPVILPAAGQLLKNPYFKQPGPPYHVFVLTGFDGTNFIANENGTRHGHGYRYSSEILEKAWSDLHTDNSAAGGRNFLTLDL
jgi:uncharacterized protein YvpB